MARWKILEAYLVDHDLLGHGFTSQMLAADWNISNSEASGYVKAYLDAQRRGLTRFVLHREGRTSTASWFVGQRTADARAIGQVFFSDVKVKMRRALEPDLRRIAEINPRAARTCNSIITAVADGAAKVLEAAVMGVGLDEE